MPARIGDQKQCCRCKEIKHVFEFQKKSKHKDGLSYYCKSCTKTANDKNREHLRELDKKSYYKNQKKRIVKSNKYRYDKLGKKLPDCWKQYLLESRKEVNQKDAYQREKQRIQKYKQENRCKMREGWKDYYYFDLQTSRERAKINTRKYRTRKEGLVDDLTQNDINFLLQIQNRKCANCKIQFSNIIPYEIDHVIPVTKFGDLVLGNVQLLCRSCNASKGTKIIWYRERPELFYSELT